MFSAIDTLLLDSMYYRYKDDTLIPDPSGCAVCGMYGERNHGHSFSGVLHEKTGDGGHYWVAPSQELRLLRMKARRDIRKQK